MTEIKVDPDQLKELADGIQKSEDKVDDALGKLSWTFSSFLVGITQANTGRIKDVQAELEHHMKKYQSKLDELQEGVMLTRAQILEADKNGWDKTGEFGLELLGVYDAERIFAEYDPVTGKKITGWQRAMATGMTLATLFPPAKGVVLLGKMGVKGLKALKLIENGAEVIKQTKNVLNPAVLKKMAQASYNTVIKGPIAKTSAYLKQTAENVKNIELSLNFNVFGQLNRFDPVLEGVGHVPGKTVGEITEGIGKSAREIVGKAKDTIVRFSGKGKYNNQTMKHIYHGEINRRGKAVGYHHESMRGGKIIQGSESIPDKNGIYRAKVDIDGVEKVAKSTFFPKEWNRVDVLKAIDEAFDNKKQVGPNKFKGVTSSGIKIEMYLNKDGSIATAYPLYKK
ncbi:hypothetical protein D5E69_20250 [Rossellomorea marisflavi]|uniref:EndoU domain-containing protein n=1 Tax=Rossellomorea marisflavi TaxID=189381 RepID=UPI0013196806|nr:EndoU domain-containing protein [Rossellomorea marisflavi]QHA37874.1 hypothetical protein D5E69_20250 [Rossellomorea marisflavi]